MGAPIHPVSNVDANLITDDLKSILSLLQHQVWIEGNEEKISEMMKFLLDSKIKNTGATLIHNFEISSLIRNEK